MFMTSTDRAKAFISSKLKRTALIILPLAAAAVQAHAGVIFSFSGSTFSASGNATTPTAFLSGAQILNGVNGISLSGNTVFTTTSAGSGGSFACAGICAGYNTFGGGSGTFDFDTILVQYDFILSDSNGSPLNWSLGVGINGINNSVGGTTLAGGDEETGSFTISGLQGATLSSWNSFLQIDFVNNYNSGDTITLNIPAGASVDIGAAIPEPGTGSLMAIAGAALAGVAAMRRRLS
jgi:hypothetical protein